VGDALKQLYKEDAISLQRLSATFRREDLIEFLDKNRSWDLPSPGQSSLL
jgi:hypothetical protein